MPTTVAASVACSPVQSFLTGGMLYMWDIHPSERHNPTKTTRRDVVGAVGSGTTMMTPAASVLTVFRWRCRRVV